MATTESTLDETADVAAAADEEEPIMEQSKTSSSSAARIAVIGCGWWAQGWHLPHLAANAPVVEIAAVVDFSPQPISTGGDTLLSLEELSQKYNCASFTSIGDLLSDPEVGPTIDGAIVATSHASHFEVGMALLKEGIHRRRMAEAIEKEESGSSKVGKKRRRMAGHGDEDGAGNGGEEKAKIVHRALHILMEKPMATNMEEAKKIWNMSARRYPEGAFIINHTASYRPQTQVARKVVAADKIGKIRHISASMASPLMWLLDDTKNENWVSKTPWRKNGITSPDGEGVDAMKDDGKAPLSGNGFAWAQMAHIIAWIYTVLGAETTAARVSRSRSCSTTDDGTKINTVSDTEVKDDSEHGIAVPVSVYCTMTHAPNTGADVSLSAVVTCHDGTTFSLSGTALLPGSQYSDPPVGKLIRIEIYGTKGCLSYGCDDSIPESGRLELRRTESSGSDGRPEYPCSREKRIEYLPLYQKNEKEGDDEVGAHDDFEDGFYFEDSNQTGTGPCSTKSFLDACIKSSAAFTHAMAVLEEECTASIYGTPSARSVSGGETPASATSMAVEKGSAGTGGGLSEETEEEDAARPMVNDTLIGLRTVQIIDAMYRSAASGQVETIG